MANENQDREDALCIISDSIKTFAYYMRESRDAKFMEKILNDILKNRFNELNKAGEEPRYTYEAKDGSIGSIWLGRYNNPDHHCMDISFCPSPKLQEKVRYSQRVIGVINLAKQTYGLASINHYEPKEIFSHTRKIMTDWGLKESDFRRTSND